MANWVRLQDKLSGKTIVHLNTAYSHISEQARIKSTELIINRLHTICADGVSSIVTADFNSRSTVFSEAWRNFLTSEQKQQLDKNWHWIAYRNNSYELFRAQGFLDAFIEAGNRDEPKTMTCHDYLPETDLPPVNYRIDWILVWGNSHSPSISSCKIIKDAQFPIFPSDHYIVMTEKNDLVRQ